MKQTWSIAHQLFLVFFSFFLLTLVLGFFAIDRLTDFNHVSADVRDLWLPNTRFIGDLNNFTSDYRAAEGTNLLAMTETDFAVNEEEMAELDRLIAEAETGYERLHHSAVETALFHKFRDLWRDYKAVAASVIVHEHSARRPDAVQIYLTQSRVAYNAASDALAQITERNVANAREASERSDLAYRHARWLIGAAMAAAGLATIGALFYVRRSLSTPLLDLADCMRRLAANDMNVAIGGTERADEIGEMARSVVVFRSNAIELTFAQRSLARQASMLEEKLNHERQLAELQRNFVSMASHEFRTPLTIIDGHAQRLAKLNGGATPTEIGERSEKIRGAVLRMTSLIDGLLHSTRIIEGELYFHRGDLDIHELLNEVCRLHREIAPRAQILENFRREPVRMEGDAKLLFQVFSNLLSNAIKYSPGGGLIKVSTQLDNGRVVVHVEDRGIGIPAADIDRLCTRYFRGSNVSGIVGTGVGLYLVKIVLDLHGGDISVESREGKGTRFSTSLPTKMPERTASRDAPGASAMELEESRTAR
jgi:two-component system, OmpR family, sensor kinase